MYFKIPHHGANQGSGMSLFLHTFCSYTVCSMGKSTEGLADKSAFERGDDLRSRTSHREPLAIPYLSAMCQEVYYWNLLFQESIYLQARSNSTVTVQPQALSKFINEVVFPNWPLSTLLAAQLFMTRVERCRA